MAEPELNFPPPERKSGILGYVSKNPKKSLLLSGGGAFIVGGATLTGLFLAASLSPIILIILGVIGTMIVGAVITAVIYYTAKKVENYLEEKQLAKFRAKEPEMSKGKEHTLEKDKAQNIEVSKSQDKTKSMAYSSSRFSQAMADNIKELSNSKAFPELAHQTRLRKFAVNLEQNMFIKAEKLDHINYGELFLKIKRITEASTDKRILNAEELNFFAKMRIDPKAPVANEKAMKEFIGRSLMYEVTDGVGVRKAELVWFAKDSLRTLEAREMEYGFKDHLDYIKSFNNALDKFNINNNPYMTDPKELTKDLVETLTADLPVLQEHHSIKRLADDMASKYNTKGLLHNPAEVFRNIANDIITTVYNVRVMTAEVESKSEELSSSGYQMKENRVYSLVAGGISEYIERFGTKVPNEINAITQFMIDPANVEKQKASQASADLTNFPSLISLVKSMMGIKENIPSFDRALESMYKDDFMEALRDKDTPQIDANIKTLAQGLVSLYREPALTIDQSRGKQI